jgi:hypothetical protein
MPIFSRLGSGRQIRIINMDKLLKQLQTISTALKNVNEVFEDFENNLDHMRTHSNCCDALLVNGICSDCREHAVNQFDE